MVRYDVIRATEKNKAGKGDESVRHGVCYNKSEATRSVVLRAINKFGGWKLQESKCLSAFL